MKTWNFQRDGWKKGWWLAAAEWAYGGKFIAVPAEEWVRS